MKLNCDNCDGRNITEILSREVQISQSHFIPTHNQLYIFVQKSNQRLRLLLPHDLSAMLNYIRTTVNTLLQQSLWYRPNAAETWGNGPIHFYRGALVTCHGLGVVKWMNGIRAQALLGGCLCDVLPGWTRLPSQPDLNSKSSHHRTHTSMHVNVLAHKYTLDACGVWILSNTLWKGIKVE